jgi:hypothetical protein
LWRISPNTRRKLTKERVQAKSSYWHLLLNQRLSSFSTVGMINVLLEALVKSTSDRKGSNMNSNMKNATNKFYPATNWVTAGLLTVVVASFGIFAETHVTKREITFNDVRTDVSASISTHAVKLLTDCEDAVEDTIEDKSEAVFF